MARYSAGMTAAGAGTTVRPVIALLATAAVRPKVREIGIFNTTAVSAVYELVQFTGGTAGATITAFDHDLGVLATPTCLAKQLWTADAGTIVKTGYRIQLGGAIGSGGIFTFGDNGISPALGATIGIGLVPAATGQVCEVYIVWDE